MSYTFDVPPGVPEGLSNEEPGHDPSARVAALLMRQRSSLFAYLLTAVRSVHDAEDLLQEVSLTAIRRAGDYRPDAPFGPWVRGIARICLLNSLAAARRAPTLLSDELLALLEEAALEEDRNEVQNLEAERRALEECLKALGGISREVIELRYLRGQSVPQVASRLGRPLRATYQFLARAREALRRCTDRRLNVEA